MEVASFKLQEPRTVRFKLLYNVNCIYLVFHPRKKAHCVFPVPALSIAL